MLSVPDVSKGHTTLLLKNKWLLRPRTWFQASAAEQTTTAFFWGITQQVVVISYRSFGTMPIIVQQDAAIYSLLYFCKLLYMFRVVTPPIIRSTYNCNHSIWLWSNFGKCSVWSQLKMSGMDRTVCATVPSVLPSAIAEGSTDGTVHTSHLQLTSHAAFSEVWPVPDAVITVICAPDDGWSYHPKHVEQFTEI